MKKQLFSIIAISIIVIILICIVLINNKFTKHGNIAVIYSDDKITHEIDLSAISEPYEFDITTRYGSNRIRVEPNRIAIISADCPDSVCVNMGYISSGSTPLICLPHHLCIEIIDPSTEYDAVGGSMQ